MLIKLKNIIYIAIIAIILNKDAQIISNISELVGFYKSISTKFNSSYDLNSLINEICLKKIVMLGESTHGTSEFYNLRFEITKKLVQNCGFRFVAIEGDWESIYKIDKYINKTDESDNSKTIYNLLNAYTVWPKWIWANKESASFIQWLKNYNNKQQESRRIHIYGLDLYGYQSSIKIINIFFKKYIPEKYGEVNSSLNCIYNGDSDCLKKLDDIVIFLENLNKNSLNINENSLNINKNILFHVLQSSYVIKYAYLYYLKNGLSSYRWNIRTENFYKLLINILYFYGEDTKAVLLFHNNHIGDLDGANFDFGDLYNLKELLKKKFKKSEIFSLGFTTASGNVIASEKEGKNPKIFNIAKPIPYSFEDILYKIGEDRLIIDFYKFKNRSIFNKSESSIDLKYFDISIWHRAFGTIYNPKIEKYHYTPITPYKRYDSLIFIKKTESITIF